MMKPPVTIVGGGLVGSLLAVLLARRGYPVEVYEKRPDMRQVKISAGRSINLALAARGMRALEQAGIMDQIQPLLIPMRGRMLHLVDGSTEFSSYGQRPHEVIYSVSRLLLNQVLLTAAERSPGVKLFFDQECVRCDLLQREVGFQQTITGAIKSVGYEWLIGTDGANSITRDAVVRGGGGTHQTDWLDHDYKELTIPADAAGGYQMERDALHIWPRKGFMLIALPNLDGSFTVTLFLEKQGATSFAQLTGPTAVRSFFEHYFPDASALIPDLEHDFFQNPTGVLGTVRASSWTDRQGALLLGDAAHAVVPFHGQGMNAGFEDCRELDEWLERHGDDWRSILAAYASERIPNANAIADLALENYVTMRDSVLDPLFQFKKELAFEIERRYPDQFIPQYSMVMFHHEIPYRIAQQRGMQQDRLLTELASALCQGGIPATFSVASLTAQHWQRITDWITSNPLNPLADSAPKP